MNLASIFELLNARAGAVAVVDANGDQITSFSSVATPPANATITSVASSVTSVVLLAANASRRGFRINNESTKILKVAFAATATAAAYTIIMAANTDYESPFGDYTGV